MYYVTRLPWVVGYLGSNISSMKNTIRCYKTLTQNSVLYMQEYQVRVIVSRGSYINS